MNNQELAPIKVYSLKQLALLYGINPRTLAKWMEPFNSDFGEKVGNLYTPRQVELIFEKIGRPAALRLSI